MRTPYDHKIEAPIQRTLLKIPWLKPIEFDGFRELADLSSFTLNPNRWIDCTATIDKLSGTDRYADTYSPKGIAKGLSQPERLRRLNQIAIHQMRILMGDNRLTLLVGRQEGGDAPSTVEGGLP